MRCWSINEFNTSATKVWVVGVLKKIKRDLLATASTFTFVGKRTTSTNDDKPRETLLALSRQHPLVGSKLDCTAPAPALGLPIRISLVRELSCSRTDNNNSTKLWLLFRQKARLSPLSLYLPTFTTATITDWNNLLIYSDLVSALSFHSILFYWLKERMKIVFSLALCGANFAGFKQRI